MCVCVLEVTDRKTSRGILLFYVIKCNHLTSNTYCPSNQWTLFTRNSNKMLVPDLVHDVLQQTPVPNRKGTLLSFTLKTQVFGNFQRQCFDVWYSLHPQSQELSENNTSAKSFCCKEAHPYCTKTLTGIGLRVSGKSFFFYHSLIFQMFHPEMTERSK